MGERREKQSVRRGMNVLGDMEGEIGRIDVMRERRNESDAYILWIPYNSKIKRRKEGRNRNNI